MAKQLIMRVLGAAITLIVLSFVSLAFAPSVAQAHQGHQHHASVHAGHGQAMAQEAERATPPASLQQAQLKQANALADLDRDCVGSCCNSACAACCAAGLPNHVQLVPYPRATTRVGFAPSQMRPDHGPESLRRPPRSPI